ncbi:hypothetical protein VB002_10580 [Campylobacter concisus]
MLYADDKDKRASMEAEFKAKMHIPDGYPVGSGAMSEVPDEVYPCLFTTGRKVYHYHTGTMTRSAHR